MDDPFNVNKSVFLIYNILFIINYVLYLNYLLLLIFY